MKVKFFQDNFNDRRTRSWVNGEYVTEVSTEIEEYKGLGVRWEEVDPPEVEKVIKVTREKAKKAIEKTKQDAADKRIKEENKKLKKKV